MSLRVDWWKDRFAVDLESSPQGLPDLLCICKISRSCLMALWAPSSPSSQPALETRTAVCWLKTGMVAHTSSPSSRWPRHEFDKFETSLGSKQRKKKRRAGSTSREGVTTSAAGTCVDYLSQNPHRNQRPTVLGMVMLVFNPRTGTFEAGN